MIEKRDKYSSRHNVRKVKKGKVRYHLIHLLFIIIIVFLIGLNTRCTPTVPHLLSCFGKIPMRPIAEPNTRLKQV